MVFSSLFFLFGFLPLFLLCYFAAPERHKNLTLLLASGIFYFWGAPRFAPIAIATSVFDYWASLRIASAPERGRAAKTWMWACIVLNVLVLFYFKYSNFFVDQLNDALRHMKLAPMPWVSVALPIGISFITFEKISYIVDVYTRRVSPAPNFRTYLLFLALFPHLIAGPIFRYHDIAGQLVSRRVTPDDLFTGLQRFTMGLGKKVLLADPASTIADKIFTLRVDDLSPSYAWLGAFAYAFQIYYDFSGYSDMAIGLGRMTGFHFLENFDRPYLSQSITEFWRRWHISLSNWMREYLYFPLGGNRRSTLRTYVNLWTVFLISGLWHGANWTFLFWGFYHGLFLVLDRLFLLRLLERIPAVLRTALTFLIVTIGWVPFRAATLHEAASYWYRMLQFFNPPPDERVPLLAEIASNRALAVFCVCAVITFFPWERFRVLFRARTPEAAWVGLSGAAALALLFLSTLALTNSQFHPFIYFRF